MSMRTISNPLTRLLLKTATAQLPSPVNKIPHLSDRALGPRRACQGNKLHVAYQHCEDMLNSLTERINDEGQLLAIQTILFQSLNGNDVKDEQHEEVGVLDE